MRFDIRFTHELIMLMIKFIVAIGFVVGMIAILSSCTKKIKTINSSSILLLKSDTLRQFDASRWHPAIIDTTIVLPVPKPINH